MKPISISVKNLASYKEEMLNYGDLADLSCVTGKNGSGKSSLFVDAITIALFNQARCTDSKGTGMENLISTNEECMEVTFKFESDESEIVVTRRRFLKGGQELELFIDGVSHTDKIKETQQKINNIIKVDYETFLDSVCIGQGESGRFMKKKPDERKEVFTKVLGLDKYEALQEYTKEIRKGINEKIKINKKMLDDLVAILSEKSNLEEKIKTEKENELTLVETLSEKQTELENEIAKKTQYEQIKKQIDYIVGKKSDLISKINSLSSSIQKGTDLKKSLDLTIMQKSSTLQDLQDESEKLTNLQGDVTNLVAQKGSMETKNDLLMNEVRDLKAKHTRLKDFNDADCEFCGQQINDTHKQQHLSDLSTKGKKLLSDINDNKLVIEKINQDIKDKNSEISFIKNKVNRLQEKKSEIEQAEAKLGGVIQRLQELQSDLKERKDELVEVEKLPIENVENQKFKDVEIKTEINNINQKLIFCRNSIAIATDKLDSINKKQGEFDDLEKETKSLNEEIAILDELVVAFGKDGIQAIIIDNALPEIQEEINKFLGLLTDDRVTIDFVTQKEKGKGKKTKSIETLDIVINDEFGSRTYETYSGGEKFRVDFSCHVGLAKFLAKRAGASIKFFIVDEGIGSQDEVAKEQFVKAAYQLTTMFDKTIIITHIPDIIDSFHGKIEIYKDQKNGSKIRIVS